jgi:hypothetical protein
VMIHEACPKRNNRRGAQLAQPFRVRRSSFQKVDFPGQTDELLLAVTS